MFYFLSILVVVGYLSFRMLLRKRRKADPQKPVTWYLQLSSAALLTFMLVETFLHPVPGITIERSLITLWITIVAVSWLGTVESFFASRPQFSLRGLLILTFAVALICGICHYAPYQAVLPGVMLLIVLSLTIIEGRQHAPRSDESDSHER